MEDTEVAMGDTAEVMVDMADKLALHTMIINHNENRG